jgi:prepilin-type N-terminal cleavage/methylation domain-containing protein
MGNPSLSKNPLTKGFSLVEVLAVLTVICLLVSVTSPALSGLMGSGNTNRAIYGASSVMDLARQYAVSNNTYTWLVLASNPSASGGGSNLYAVILGSKDGSNTSDGVTAIDLDTQGTYDLTNPSSNLAVLQKAEVYRGAQLGTLSQDPAPVSPVPADPNTNVSFKFPASAAEATAFFNANLTAQRVVQFSPNGQSRVSGSMSQVIEVGLQGMKGNVPDVHNVAAIQIDEFTGQTRVYRN